MSVSPGVPDPVPGLACLGTNLPTNVPGPYGTLSAAISDSATLITIVPVAGGVPLPTSGTFPLVISRERMQATYVSPNTYSVARGQGGTTAVGYSAGAPVMSTPLPIIPNVAPFNTFAAVVAVRAPASMR